MITSICQKPGITNSLLLVKYMVNTYDWVFNLNSYKLRENGNMNKECDRWMNSLYISINQRNYFSENHFLLALQIRYKIQNIIFFYKFSPFYSSKIPFCHRLLLISILTCARERTSCRGSNEMAFVFSVFPSNCLHGDDFVGVVFCCCC